MCFSVTGYGGLHLPFSGRKPERVHMSIEAYMHAQSTNHISLIKQACISLSQGIDLRQVGVQSFHFSPTCSKQQNQIRVEFCTHVQSNTRYGTVHIQAKRLHIMCGLLRLAPIILKPPHSRFYLTAMEKNSSRL